MAVMNEQQYKIVKTMTNFPKFNTSKFARMIGVKPSEVMRVQRSLNYEDYKSDEDFMETLFGGKL